MASLGLEDIPNLEQDIENAEGNDKELHKLWNNVGVAYRNERMFKESLHAHRQEKKACKRLLESAKHDLSRIVDLSIAYRQVGDAIANVEALKLGDGRILRNKADILAQSLKEHSEALEYAEKALAIDPESVSASCEVQAALSNLGRTFCDLGHATKDEETVQRSLDISYAAVSYARNLPKSIRKKERQRRVFLAAINQALAMNELGMYEQAVRVLQTIAARANGGRDDQNFIRAMANMVDAYKGLSDLENARKYADIWALRAQQQRDTHEEATAREKLAGILSKLYKFADARDALKRALSLQTDEETRKNIQAQLDAAESNLEADARDADKLKICEDDIATVCIPKQEAELRYEAGNLCFALRRYPKCVEHLERLMLLMDENKLECSPENLGLSKQKHGRVVADLADACWRCKNFDAAIKWGMRELLVYGDELAGQAQAWCNLGTYLAEIDVDKGIEALEKAIKIGEECGEKDIVTVAQNNLDIELEKQGNLAKESRKQASIPVVKDVPGDVINLDDIPVPDKAEELLPRITAKLKENKARRGSETDRDALSGDPTPTKRRPQLPDEENSIVVFSGQDISMPGLSVEHSMAVSRSGANASCTTSSAVFSVSRPLSRGADSRGRSTVSGLGTRSAATGGAFPGSTTTRYKNLIDSYKQLCSSTATRGPRARDKICDVLREVSASSLVQDAGSMVVNLSGHFLKENELRPVILALCALDNAQTVQLNLARNSLLSESSYTVLLEQQAPRTIVDLDLTASGVNVRILSVLIRAVGKNCALQGLIRLNLSKNALGRDALQAADACGDLMMRSGKLIELDLTWNALPSSFLSRFVARMKEGSLGANDGATCILSWLHLKLNNVRNPNALLEFESTEEAVQCFTELFRVAPLMNEIDLRVCGAKPEMRRALYEARSQFGWPIMLVSSNVQDNAVL